MRDTDIKGFGVRALPSGVKSFIFERRINGRVRRLTIGKVADLSVEKARKQAEKLAGEIAVGEDPVAKKKAARAVSLTLREALTEYLADNSQLKERTRSDYTLVIESYLSDWLDKPLSRISGDDVVQKHKKIAGHAPVRANLVFRYFRAVWNGASDRYSDQLGTNPVGKLTSRKAWTRVKPKEGHIKKNEFPAWWGAVESLASRDISDLFKFFVLTGLRKSEALDLKWSSVDFKDRSITLLDTKNHNDHTLPLSGYLLELLKRRHLNKPKEAEYVFEGKKGRISNIRYSLDRIEKESDVRVTPHDLRRTFASVAAHIVPAYILKRLMNHATSGDITASYVQATTEDLRESMQKVTDTILRLSEVAP